MREEFRFDDYAYWLNLDCYSSSSSSSYYRDKGRIACMARSRRTPEQKLDSVDSSNDEVHARMALSTNSG